MTKCSFTVDGNIFCHEAILKASYLFSDDYYVNIFGNNNGKVTIEIESKTDIQDDAIDKKFKNELLAQMLRYRLSEKHKAERELIIGRALYSTCIEVENTVSVEYEEHQDVTLDDIAVDWFEVN